MQIRLGQHILSGRAERAISVTRRACGLLGRTTLADDEALIIDLHLPLVPIIVFALGVALFVHTLLHLSALLSALLFCAIVFLLLLPSKAIHTIGMKFAIDLLFLDRSNRVLEYRHAVPPGRLIFPCWKRLFQIARVVELPGGKLHTVTLKMGDALTLLP